MKNVVLIFKKISTFIENVETHFITLFTLIMGLIIILDVAFRNLGFQGFAWVEEFGRFMLVVTTIIGCSVAVKSKGHMVMDALYNALPTRWAYAIKAIAYAICSALYLYLSYFSYNWMLKQQLMRKTMQSIQFPAWIMWLFIVYGIFTMGSRYLVQTVKCIIQAVKGESTFTEMNTKEN